MAFTSAIDQFGFPIGAANQVIDPGFSAALNGWQITPSDASQYGATYTQPGNGGTMLSFWSKSAYNTTVWQTATALPNGTYTLTTWIENGGGQQSATMFADPLGGSSVTVNLPVASTWTQVQIPNISVTKGQVYLGFAINANPSNWTNVGWVSLQKN